MQPTQREIKQYNELLQTMTNKKSLEDCQYLGKRPKKKQQHEADEQCEVIKWAKLQSAAYPELERLMAIPNGGSRNKLEAYNLKKQGVRPGVPDLLLPVVTKKYPGLWIEMKHGKDAASIHSNS